MRTLGVVTLVLCGAAFGGSRPEVSWSVMHPTAIDTNCFARVVEKATEDGVIAEYSGKRFGAAASQMIPLLKSELEMVRDISYVASNLTFHAFPIQKDFKYVKAGGIFDDGRVKRMMHAAYSEMKSGRVVRQAGNNRYPNGRITVRLAAPRDAVVSVVLDGAGASTCDVDKSWNAGFWTVSVGKTGKGYPIVSAIVAGK